MSSSLREVDAVIVGGGFFGCALALKLIEFKKVSSVIIIEKEDTLLKRASKINQARVHNGYHYPRSFTTAFRSRVNFPRFCSDYREAIDSSFEKIYAIAKINSKVSARQFERFFSEVGAEFEPASKRIESLFEPRLIEKAYKVKEYAFNALVLADILKESLNKAKVDVLYSSEVAEIFKNTSSSRKMEVRLKSQNNFDSIYTDLVFNCTYSGINSIGGDFAPTKTTFKHEIAELALVELPEEYRDIGITVMDGAYFSVMPYPAENLHSLSHVRYTPHHSFLDQKGISPYKILENFPKETRVDRMIRDARRYAPFIDQCAYKKSIFEVKTVLIKNERDDGRPILFEQNRSLPKAYSILGSKIDNVYDVFKAIENI
jgi:glycine/D-amino acid oxidase-like deaminating enzyme